MVRLEFRPIQHGPFHRQGDVSPRIRGWFNDREIIACIVAEISALVNQRRLRIISAQIPVTRRARMRPRSYSNIRVEIIARFLSRRYVFGRFTRHGEMCDILRGIPGILCKRLESPRDREIKDNYETLLVTRLLQQYGVAVWCGRFCHQFYKFLYPYRWKRKSSVVRISYFDPDRPIFIYINMFFLSILLRNSSDFRAQRTISLSLLLSLEKITHRVLKTCDW